MMENHDTRMTRKEFESVFHASSNESMLVAVLLAVAFHALVILGISFAPEDFSNPDSTLPTLDIVMVEKSAELDNEQADYLAASSQAGGGNTREKVPFKEAREQLTPSTPPPTAAPPKPETLTSTSEKKIQVAELTPSPETPKPSAAELHQRSMELLQLNQQIKQSWQAYSEQPRQTYISAATKKFKYANYMNDWVAKVERIGNLNYPDAARRQGISGKLILDVALRPDGSIYNITVRRPSGHKVLDDAAINIVRLAAPYPPFPEDIRKETDILHITRTWEFLSTGLQSR